MCTLAAFRSTVMLTSHRCTLHYAPLGMLGRQPHDHDCRRCTRHTHHLPSTLFAHRPCVLTSTTTPPMAPSNPQRHLAKWVNLRVLPLSLPEIVQASPPAWQPYMRLVRLDKPIGNWLLFLPSAWSFTLAAAPSVLPDARLVVLFALGACMMRGAGCTINDMWDKDYDSKVSRTSDRPLASGALSRGQALSFLALQLSTALGILLSFDNYTIILGSSCLLLVVTYPLMKRITYWPQLFLGVTFNFGTVMGWSAATSGAVQWSVVLPLFTACAAWTLVYDTIYAHQDKEDDLIAGVKSTALRFGDNSKLWLSGFASVMASSLVATGYLSDQPWPYYVGVAFVASHIAHQIYTVDLTRAEDCGSKFRSNRNLGIVFWAAIIAANLHRRINSEDEEKLDEAS